MESATIPKASKKSKIPIDPIEDATEEPVLSHKAARKSKKRKADDITPDAAAEKVEGQEAGKKEMTIGEAARLAREGQGKKTPYGVWIGNMSFKTEQSQLKNWLAGCGTIARCHMPAGIGGKDVKNKGCASNYQSLFSSKLTGRDTVLHTSISKQKQVRKQP